MLQPLNWVTSFELCVEGIMKIVHVDANYLAIYECVDDKLTPSEDCPEAFTKITMFSRERDVTTIDNSYIRERLYNITCLAPEDFLKSDATDGEWQDNPANTKYFNNIYTMLDRPTATLYKCYAAVLCFWVRREPSKKNQVYNIYTMLDRRRRRQDNIIMTPCL